MNKYELTIILSGKATPAKVKSFKEKFEKILTVNKGKIVKTGEWGKLDLSTKFKGNETGNFLLFNIELEPTSFKTVNDKLRTEDEIIRYLLIRED
jgi:small subunit ribosomal protein S6